MDRKILMEKAILLNNNWIVGFTDAEGYFCVSFSKRAKMLFGVEVRPRFMISQSATSKDIIFEIEKYFKCGGIKYSKRDNCYIYEVKGLTNLNEIIIPFFENNSLFTKKREDFLLFRDICRSIKEGKHLNKDGLQNIIKKAYLMNVSGKRKYTEEELSSYSSSFSKS